MSRRNIMLIAAAVSTIFSIYVDHLGDTGTLPKEAARTLSLVGGLFVTVLVVLAWGASILRSAGIMRADPNPSWRVDSFDRDRVTLKRRFTKRVLRWHEVVAVRDVGVELQLDTGEGQNVRLEGVTKSSELAKSLKKAWGAANSKK
ncbi:MAG: hypothetical protein R3A78_03465 [Polyangiales bacterium]|nr:hypothetical protein [Myxococcales bacterium]